MKKHLYCAVLILFLSFIPDASVALQSVRGRVTSSSSALGVSNAFVRLEGRETYSSVTDSTGQFILEAAPGNYKLIVQKEGFRIFSEDQITVFSGKERVIDVSIQELRADLPEVSTSSGTAERFGSDDWNLQNFAAVFYDPVRVLNSNASIVNTDDQANNVTIRGTSPNYMQWKLEEVEVVNPNHLENAGTVNDRPSLNGGGVTMLSAQMLQRSGFQFAPFHPSSGNALSGVFDLRFRNGNNQRHERIIQASLLGTDLCVEGPFTKTGAASFLINARYSTVGLLSLLGVNFGNEQISYKDLSFVVAVPHRRGALRVFGITGDSKTLSFAYDDTTLVETQKDLSDIRYSSFSAIGGVSNTVNISSRAFFKTVVSWSYKEVSRDANPALAAWYVPPVEDDLLMQEKLSTLNYVSARVGQALHLKGGTYINYFESSIRSVRDDQRLMEGTIYEPVIQPFVSLEGLITKRFEMRAGVHALFQERTGHFVPLPSAMLRFLMSSNQDISFSYGAAAQLQPASLYISHGANRNLHPTTSQNFSLNYSLRWKSSELRPTVYYHLFDHVPVSPVHDFSAFNYFNEMVDFPLTSTGTAEAAGAELSYEIRKSNFYIVASAGVCYTNVTTGVSNRRARFDPGYNGVLTGGKVFPLKNGNDRLGLDLRGVGRDGFLESGSSPFVYDRRLPFYSRLDLRFSYSRNKKRSSVIWAIDVQNLLNTQNVAYHYYDQFSRSRKTKYQLGIIPVLSYKVMF